MWHITADSLVMALNVRTGRAKPSIYRRVWLAACEQTVDECEGLCQVAGNWR